MSADLVARLRAHAARDNCVSHNWGETPLDAGCDCSDAADEIERLERERAEWAGVAATRNVNIALIAEERDRLFKAIYAFVRASSQGECAKAECWFEFERIVRERGSRTPALDAGDKP